MPFSAGHVGSGGGDGGLLACLLICLLSIFIESMYVNTIVKTTYNLSWHCPTVSGSGTYTYYCS